MLCEPLPLITGAVIALGIVGAWITGYLARFGTSPVVSSLHFPFTCLGFLGLVAHSYNLIFPFGTYFVLATFIVCLMIYGVFFFFNPIQPMMVDGDETVWLSGKNEYSFLVVNYNNSNTIPPGSFFLIYSNQRSNLSHFHAHSFPVFSSTNQRISFLVHCRIPEYSNDTSFTQRLSIVKYPTLPLVLIFLL